MMFTSPNSFSKMIQRGSLILGFLFCFEYAHAFSASGSKISLDSCTTEKVCYKISAARFLTSQFAPLWKFYDGSFILNQKTYQFGDATWDQVTDLFYFESEGRYLVFNPITGSLKSETL